MHEPVEAGKNCDGEIGCGGAGKLDDK